MVQLQEQRNAIEDAGITLVAVSYDPHDSLKEFAEQRGITYPLLSDEGSHTIDAYGIRDAQGEGIPHPGTILIDSAGFIRAKLFQEGFAARHSVEALIAAAKGLK